MPEASQLPAAWHDAELPTLPPLGPDAVAEFTRTIYGRTPGGGELTGLVLQTREDGVLDGAADRLRHRATVRCPSGDLEFETLLHLPAGTAAAPVAVILNFDGNDDTLTTWPYEKITRAGFAVLTANYHQIEPDDPNPPAPGVRALFPAESWGAVAAWAWGLSRLLDIAENLTATSTEAAGRIDVSTAIVLGHSRLGKAALWAGVQDERFTLTVSNDSGCCGAALFRHPGGEDIEAITRRFPHWFVPSFTQYAGKESDLPVDQHQLLASIAPRRVLVLSAQDDEWADPVGEYLAVVAASPAFGENGIRYHLRSGGHALLEEDWLQAVSF